VFPRFLLFLLIPLAAFAEPEHGSADVYLRDSTGALLAGCVQVENASKDFTANICEPVAEKLEIRNLPLGRFSIVASSAGFTSQARTIDIRAAERVSLDFTLAVAPANSNVRVTAESTLLDPSGASGNRLSAATIARLPSTTPGRRLIDAVQTQPGWVLEANGVLHPRGSEYDTTYVIDGLPITSNRSPAFAPEHVIGGVDSLEIVTGGYPAEYGRHLGGIVEVTAVSAGLQGVHGAMDFERSSFATTAGSLGMSYASKKTGVSFSGSGFGTDRYLDPPTEANYTNSAMGRSFNAHIDHNISDTQSIRLSFSNAATSFAVPNEEVQQASGQRQEREIGESAGYAGYDYALSSKTLFSARGIARYGNGRLNSNASSMPIRPEQNRDLHEQYLSLSLATQKGDHELKAGAQLSHIRLSERFAYAITSPDAFDPDVPPRFDFSGAHGGHTEALFLQDRYQRNGWTISAGLRFDRYRLLTTDAAISPRLSVAYHAAPIGAVFHASYDRVFEEPPVENLLLASSTSVLRLGTEARALPIPLARGDFAEAGVSKLFGSALRIDASTFLRNTRNFIDDDVLLNTGVSLPASFARASIYGAEARIELRDWHRFSGVGSYSYLLGRTVTPVTGGLFLHKDAEELLEPGLQFPISQDQRNTFRGLLRYAFNDALWASVGFSCGSGLPVELEEELSRDELIAQSSARIVERLDLDRGRVKPNRSVDLSLGWRIWQREQQSLRVQLDVRNIANELNVVNFSGLFSGAAMGSPRSASIRAGYSF
jgi:hypothetical protein